MPYIICHYHEIGLKGKNRKFFEEKLIENIKKTLDKDYFSFVKRISGRILIKLTERGKKREKEIFNALKNIFGIANFASVESCQPKITLMQKKAFELLSKENFKTFRVTTQRSEKEFPLTSQEINERVGEFILKKLKVRLDLSCPEVIIYIEVVEKYVFLYTEKIQGPGGLPVSTGGKAVALLSGGIDSPVAAYFIMKRGVKIDFIHFHAYPFTKKASINKVEKIAEIFKKYQFNSRLYLAPFADLQKEIFLKTPAKLRMILYRRAMAKIAEDIANKEKASALVTGESVGQVASQTLENIKVIDESVALPIFRPLIGFDKQEIIKKAEEIGTFKVSILPHRDCCSRFLPKHPETRAILEKVKEAENKISLSILIKKVLAKTQIKKVY